MPGARPLRASASRRRWKRWTAACRRPAAASASASLHNAAHLARGAVGDDALRLLVGRILLGKLLNPDLRAVLERLKSAVRPRPAARSECRPPAGPEASQVSLVDLLSHEVRASELLPRVARRSATSTSLPTKRCSWSRSCSGSLPSPFTLTSSGNPAS